MLPIVAALLGRTSRITVATDRLAASLHNPIRLAEDAIALDLLSGGRFILGLSLCYRREEFDGFRVDPSTDAERLEALARFLRAAFEGRAAKIEGREVLVTPGPSTAGGPRLMIAADGQDGGARAARLADMLMVDPTEPQRVVDAEVATFDRERGDAPVSRGLCNVLVERAPIRLCLRGERRPRRNEQRCRQPSTHTHLTVLIVGS